MYGYFAVRRLMECYKLSSASLTLTLPLVHYPFRPGSHMTLLNADDVDRHFDLTRPFRASMPLRDISNQLIHSYIFVLSLQLRGSLAGVFVSSEYRRRRALTYIPAWRTCRVFRRLADDWPNDVHLHYDARLGDFHYDAKTRRN
jgi:hypothetical protein